MTVELNYAATFKRLTDLDVSGKHGFFIRDDLNVLQNDNPAIADAPRVRAALPGLKDMRSSKALP